MSMVSFVPIFVTCTIVVKSLSGSIFSVLTISYVISKSFDTALIKVPLQTEVTCFVNLVFLCYEILPSSTSSSSISENASGVVGLMLKVYDRWPPLQSTLTAAIAYWSASLLASNLLASSSSFILCCSAATLSASSFALILSASAALSASSYALILSSAIFLARISSWFLISLARISSCLALSYYLAASAPIILALILK